PLLLRPYSSGLAWDSFSSSRCRMPTFLSCRLISCSLLSCSFSSISSWTCFTSQSIRAFASWEERARAMAVETDGTNRTESPGEEQGLLARILDSDLLHSFLRNRLVVVAAIVTLAFVLVSLLAPWIAPHDPYDVR